jgi:hypothetical protein
MVAVGRMSVGWGAAAVLAERIFFSGNTLASGQIFFFFHLK